MFAAMMATVSENSWAQTPEKPLSKSAQRKIERQKENAQYAERMEQALANGQVYFLGQQMQIKNLDRYPLRAPYNYVDIQPGYVRVQLPYFTSVNTMGNAPMIIDFESDNFEYKFDKKKDTYIVTLSIRDVKNTYNMPNKLQGGGYRLVFTIPSSIDGTTMLNLSPGFTAPIIYTGTMDFNESRP